MVRRTVPILVWFNRSSVDGRPIRTTCGTDQQVIPTGVDGALVGPFLDEMSVHGKA